MFVFFFFFPPYTFVRISLSPPSFLSFSPSFKNVPASALILSLFSLALALCLFIYLLDSRTIVVFVKRVGGKGYLCNSTMRALSLHNFPPDLGGCKLWAWERKFSLGFSILNIFLLLPNNRKHCFPP